jgi:hypothetical protein
MGDVGVGWQDERVTTYDFAAPLWQWEVKDEATSGAWFFVSLPFDVSDEIEATAGPGNGFGSVRVEATVGTSTWRTSVFPSGERKTYVLPVKKAVRLAEGLSEGTEATVRLSLV